MKQHQYRSREDYIRTQVLRSQAKMGYCKVFFADILRYRRLLSDDAANRGERNLAGSIEPILCLGVRSGSEVDMFRAAFFSPLLASPFLQALLIREDTTKIAAQKALLSRKYGWGSGQHSDGRVLGVEINPDGARDDVWVGSFDELPAEWTDRFRLLYTNSFDHTQDVEQTIREWKRVAAPGAYLVLAFPAGAQPSETDPLGGLKMNLLKDMWQAEIVFATETMNRNGYHEICFRL